MTLVVVNSEFIEPPQTRKQHWSLHSPKASIALNFLLKINIFFNAFRGHRRTIKIQTIVDQPLTGFKPRLLVSTQLLLLSVEDK